MKTFEHESFRSFVKTFFLVKVKYEDLQSELNFLRTAIRNICRAEKKQIFLMRNKMSVVAVNPSGLLLSRAALFKNMLSKHLTEAVFQILHRAPHSAADIMDLFL